MSTLNIIDVDNNLCDKTTLRILKSQRSKLLNRKCSNYNQFEQIQETLNEVEFNIKLLEYKLY